MNQEEFLDLLSRFVDRPIPALAGRHVYLWHGNLDPLTNALPGKVRRILDLHALAATQPKAPRSIDGARRVLLQAVRWQIADLLTSDRQHVLVVTGCDVLSRYRVPVGSFFEIASEHTAVVLTLPPAETRFQPSAPLPEYVSWNPHAPLDYLCKALDKGAVIDTVEE
jgi:hypothetical protein